MCERESIGHFWVGMKQIREDEILSTLKKTHPTLNVFCANDHFGIYNSADILFDVSYYQGCEFPVFVNFIKYPGKEGTEIDAGLALASRLGQELTSRTICDGSGLGDDDSPYWSVVWECGNFYLADDCGDTQFDGGMNPVKIVRQLFI